MKVKKISICLIIAIVMLMMLAIPVHAAGFAVGLTPSKTTLSLGSTFTVGVEINNLSLKIEAFNAKLEYDSNILEMVDFKESNGWQIGIGDTNIMLGNLSGQSDEGGEIVKITFKVKESATLGDTKIAIKNAMASASGEDVQGLDNEITIRVKNIESDKYDIQEDIIKNVPADSTGTDIKNNIKTEAAIVIYDADGNILPDSSKVGTGCVVKVAGKDSYTVIVKGDLNGDGVVDITDLVKIKLHLIESKKLAGAYLEAADTNGVGGTTITVADMGKIILHIFNIERLK